LIRSSNATTFGRNVFRRRFSLVSCLPIAVISARAFSIVTPGFSRPTTASVFPRRSFSSVSGNAEYKSIVLPGAKTVAKSNDWGRTPMTVVGASLMTMRRPTMFASDAKRVRRTL
jgi:hypothetical protein